MRDPFNDKQYSDAVAMAHLRFAAIAPVLQGLFSEPSKTAYYKNIATKSFTLPNGREVYYDHNTLLKWEHRYRTAGMDGLMPQSRSDAGSSRVLSDAAIAEIYRLKEQFPRINATLTYTKLRADGFIDPSRVSLSTVQRFIKKNDLKVGRESNIKDRKAFEEEFPGYLYQADTCHSIYITEGGTRRKTYLFHIVDDHSRLIVGARFFYEDNSYNFQQVLKEAIQRYGLCKKAYLDNGGPYANKQLSLILASLGIIEIHTPVRDGAAKAKVERSFRTIKDTWLHGFDASSVTSLDELNRLLASYVRNRNLSFNRDIGEAPMDRYLRHIDRVRMVEDPEWLDACFRNRVLRRVNNDSTISIDSILYDVPMEFLRMKVEVRYLPDDMTSAYILYNGKHYPIRQTNKVENARTRRKQAIDYSKTGGEDHL